MKAFPPAGVFNACADDEFDAKSFFPACISWHQNILTPISRN